MARASRRLAPKNVTDRNLFTMDEPFPNPPTDPPSSLWAEFATFLRQNMLWWLLPLVLVLLLFLALILISGTSSTPFIYSTY